MGADIFCHIETSHDGEDWLSFGTVTPDRDYDLFGLLVGVRGDKTPLIDPRGLPLDLGGEGALEAFLFVTETGNEDGTTTRELAEAWIASGESTWRDEKQDWVMNPEYFGHSWMTPEEWRKCIEFPGRSPRDPSYFATAAAMEELQRHGLQVRVVFWFNA